MGGDEVEVSQIVETLGARDPSERAVLIQDAYEDLRRIAARKMANERLNHTLTKTALVNEVTMKMLRDERMPTTDRDKFFAYHGSVYSTCRPISAGLLIWNEWAICPTQKGGVAARRRPLWSRSESLTSLYFCLESSMPVPFGERHDIQAPSADPRFPRVRFLPYVVRVGRARGRERTGCRPRSKHARARR